MTRRILAAAVVQLGDENAVERSATGAPVAFRIWRAGANVTDYGTHVFTERSATVLVADQTARGNLYSIDVDHMSLNKESPPEARKAVGWHRLEVRQTTEGPELWAASVEWTDTVRAGLEKTPPEWRYISPAYDVAEGSGEIVSYLNCALTNTPATWAASDLGARERIAASRGDGATRHERAVRLPAKEHANMLERFGRDTRPRAPYWDGASKCYPQITRDQAVALIAAKARGGDADAESILASAATQSVVARIEYEGLIRSRR